MALKQWHKTDEVMTNNKKMGKIPTGTCPTPRSWKCETTIFEIHAREMHTTPRMAPRVDPPKEQREESTHFVEESEKEPIDTHVQIIFETGSDTNFW